MSPVIVRPMGDPADLTGCTLTVGQCAVLNGLSLALVVGRVFGSRAVERS